MKKSQNYLLPFVMAALGVFFVNAIQDNQSDRQYQESFHNHYKVYAVPLPEKLDFAGETVPMQDPDIVERLDRELLVNTYWQSNTMLLIKRANKVFPIIEPILKSYGVPDDFKYLAAIESGLIHAVSPAGAKGIWQFMPNTAKEYGLEVNENIDERYHLEKATHAACKYLLASKSKFGSWTESAAAYNAGNAGITNRIDKQEANSYYQLLLGEETSRYIFRILAIKEILKDPQKYGFYFREKDLYTAVSSNKILVNTEIPNLVAFAKEQGINYKILKIHNPWLRENKLVNKSSKEYTLEIPKEGIYKVD